jgi:hypothetical protein
MSPIEGMNVAAVSAGDGLNRSTSGERLARDLAVSAATTPGTRKSIWRRRSTAVRELDLSQPARAGLAERR